MLAVDRSSNILGQRNWKLATSSQYGKPATSGLTLYTAIATRAQKHKRNAYHIKAQRPDPNNKGCPALPGSLSEGREKEKARLLPEEFHGAALSNLGTCHIEYLVTETIVRKPEVDHPTACMDILKTSKATMKNSHISLDTPTTEARRIF